jgi:hypothetical protein
MSKSDGSGHAIVGGVESSKFGQVAPKLDVHSADTHSSEKSVEILFGSQSAVTNQTDSVDSFRQAERVL